MFLSVRRLVLVVAMACMCVLGVGVLGGGRRSSPGWGGVGCNGPTGLAPGGEGTFALYVYNVGAASEAEGPTVAETLPAGLEAVVASLPPECSGTTEAVTRIHGPPLPAGDPNNRDSRQSYGQCIG